MATDGVLCCSIHVAVAVVAVDAVDVFVDDHYVCSSVAHTRLIILKIAASRLLCSWFAL